jgi:hypothetical protein
VYLLVFHAYINEMYGSRSKIPRKKSLPYIYIYIYDVKFLALLGAPYIYDISRLSVNASCTKRMCLQHLRAINYEDTLPVACRDKNHAARYP